MARKKKVSAEPNAKCPCGSGKKYKNCCGTPARARSRKNQGRWVLPVVLVAAIGGLLVLTRSDGRMANPEQGVSTAQPDAEPARAAEQSTESADPAGPPPAWYYDSENNRYWHPEHNHWHPGPPPPGVTPERTVTPPPWSYNPLTNKHWHPEHNHWHDGPPPAEDQRNNPDAHEGHAH